MGVAEGIELNIEGGRYRLSPARLQRLRLAVKAIIGDPFPPERDTKQEKMKMARATAKKTDSVEKTVGLLTKNGESVPLQGVMIKGRLQGRAAELVVLQRYRNDESKPIEAVYLFPLPSEAAVTGLEVRVGDRTLKAGIEEREKAFERYDDALREGHGAMLLDQERPNVFQVSVGSILPGQTVLVEIRLALLADSWERGVRLMIPSTIAPRYTPSSLPPDVIREIERTTPPYALEVPFGMSVEIEAEMASAIRVVESPSHPVRAEIDGPRARVMFSRGEEAMDRDFVLTVETAEPHQRRRLRQPDATAATTCSSNCGPIFPRRRRRPATSSSSSTAPAPWMATLSTRHAAPSNSASGH